MQRRILFAGRTRAFIALGAWLAAALACAVSVPPTGGPEDKNPPRIASSVPRPDSAGVDPRSPIRIEFSEPMRRERVERMVSVSPAIEFDRVSWEANTLVIQPAGELARDTTYVVRVKPDYQDRHGVTATQWHEFAFATGAALDTARIEGTITLKRAPAAQATARCYLVSANDTLSLERDRASRETTARRDGTYQLRYLPSDNARFVVMAFMDKNNNRVYDAESDASVVYRDTVVIAPGNPVVTNIDLALIDPNDPAIVRGTVTNETGADTARVMIAMYATDDSTKAAYRAVCDSTGAYEVAAVRAGSYILRAFVDIKADSLPGLYPCPGNEKGCPEPEARRPGILRVLPAAEITEPPLAIRRKEEP